MIEGSLKTEGEIERGEREWEREPGEEESFGPALLLLLLPPGGGEISTPGRWGRQSLRNPTGMRVPSSPSCLLLLALLAGQASAYVDDDNEAIVIEGMTEIDHRKILFDNYRS